MKYVIIIVIAIGLVLGAYQLWEYWGKFKEKEPPPKSEDQGPTFDATKLPGMVPKLEPILQAAQQRGASGLKDFLTMYGKGIADPRKAYIELDYVVLVAQTNPGEARKVFESVKKRTPQSSPVYNRIRKLEKTYE